MTDLSIFDQLYTHRFEVSDAVYKSFQACSGDTNPLHTEVSFAKSKGFPECVMYGNILNCFLSYFVGMMLPTQDVIIHSQDIAFKNPVFKGDILDFSATVDGVFESVQAIEFKYIFKNADRKTVAKGHIQIGII